MGRIIVWVAHSLMLGAAIAATFTGASCSPSQEPDSASSQNLDTTCRTHSDCVVIPRTCCGHCGQPEASDMQAVHTNVVDLIRRRACAGNSDGCPGCYAYPDPSLLATCVRGTCMAVDLARTAIVHCKQRDDCRIRAASCCECDGSTEPPPLVAIRSDREADYQKLVCDGEVVCPTCERVYPRTPYARCQDDHCVIQR